MADLGSALNKALTDPRGFARKVLRRTNVEYHLLKRSFFPDVVVVIPTYRCNLRCQMCFLFDQQGKSLIPAPLREELPSLSRLLPLLPPSILDSSKLLIEYKT